MNILTIFLIAFGLSIDAFAVSVANGITNKKHKFYNALKLGLSFGFFQMLMPFIGWSAGLGIRRFIGAYGHWAAFIILCAIGIKMIHEAFRSDETQKDVDLNFFILLGLSIATSIDAFAVGISFVLLGLSIFVPILVIGILTFFMSFFGFYIGNMFGHIFEKKMEIAGGLVLIFIGIKFLIDYFH